MALKSIYMSVLLSSCIAGLTYSDAVANTRQIVCDRVSKAGSFAITTRAGGGDRNLVEQVIIHTFPPDQYFIELELSLIVIDFIFSKDDQWLQRQLPLTKEKLIKIERELYSQCINL